MNLPVWWFAMLFLCAGIGGAAIGFFCGCWAAWADMEDKMHRKEDGE
jgi:hypothetical protein